MTTAVRLPRSGDGRVTAPSTSDVLRRAADIIEQRGWTRGRFERGGRVCSFEAVALAAVALRARAWPAVDAVQRHTNSGSSETSITAWNDAQPSRQRVTAKLREVADSLEHEVAA